MSYSPITLFVYNRPWHTVQTIESLKENNLSKESDLIIFSDGIKNDLDTSKVKEVRSYLKTIQGFKNIEIVERGSNFGLAQSIISGVTDVMNRYGKVIVLEDDIVSSPYFLNFMNNALDYYQNFDKVWHISGWNYPIKSENLAPNFLWRVMNCWGWATWANRWKHFEKNPETLVNSFSKDEINRFNLEGRSDFYGQILDNYNGIRDTWAIFWYATIFRHQGLCLNPTQTFVENIGHDGTGENCGSRKDYIDQLSMIDTFEFPNEMIESIDHVKRIKKYLKSNIFNKIMRRLF